MYTHILIPTDGSPRSRRAIAAGVNFAKVVGARVTGLFCAPPATPLVYRDMMPVGYTTPRHHEKMIRDSAAHYLGVVENEAKKARVPCDTTWLTSDFPADAILATAKKLGCDLIVMASHGRRGLAGALLGSETHRVITESRIPVLVIR